MQHRSIRILIVPGLHGSGPGHWQFTWHTDYPGIEWLEQEQWDRPVREEWCAALERAVVGSTQPVVLAAHSLGCVTVAHWAAWGSVERVLGAMLVAPADVERSLELRRRASGFSPTPLARLPFSTVVVASRNDPYLGIERARFFAARWDSAFVDTGDLGHINAHSNLGEWPAGIEILTALVDEAISANEAGGVTRSAHFHPLRPAPAAVERERAENVCFAVLAGRGCETPAS